MTQQVNATGNGQIIPLRTLDKSEQVKPDKSTSAADVGKAIAQSEAVPSSGGADTVAKEPLDRAAELIEQIIPENELGNTRLRINIDDNTGDFIYQTLDNDTGEVIKQFPPETISEMLAKYREVEGLAVDSLA
ncbi:flagellar protein FlaG [Temperatibacter marinus]|uniref:Flagellar protein FlaG n=1 Tax=Temperatibacter marinus TaxID=1456591 RepID=A0AA52EGS2_9PROT|nr:flagellar protein FlaG [Temperatibacter marinus]WND02500.1 flagellar protein FlaG [Temperatibacter marinus]